MFSHTFISIRLVLVLSFIHHTITVSPSELESILKKFGAVPEVLEKPPHHVANVTWLSGASANLGNAIPHEHIRLQPEVVWPHNKSSYYTLLFTDYDDRANEDPVIKEHHLWYVTNIPGINISAGEFRLEYTAPEMQPNSERHRIAVSVLEQPGHLNLSYSEFMNPPRYYFGVMEITYDFPARIHAGNVFVVQPPTNQTKTTHHAA